jgi:hypothetical protein
MILGSTKSLAPAGLLQHDTSALCLLQLRSLEVKPMLILLGYLKEFIKKIKSLEMLVFLIT